MARTFAGFSARPLAEFRGRLTDLGRRREEDDPSVADMTFGRAPRVGAALPGGGGYEDAQMPNPNFAGGMPKGQRTSPQFGNQPAVQNALGENMALQQRADAQDKRTAEIERNDPLFMRSTRNPYLKDKRWSALLQAMTEAGADKVQTGAKAGWEQPGFYDTQSTMDAGAQNRQNLLAAMLMSEGRPQDAAFVRGIR